MDFVAWDWEEEGLRGLEGRGGWVEEGREREGGLRSCNLNCYGKWVWYDDCVSDRAGRNCQDVYLEQETRSLFS